MLTYSGEGTGSESATFSQSIRHVTFQLQTWVRDEKGRRDPIDRVPRGRVVGPSLASEVAPPPVGRDQSGPYALSRAPLLTMPVCVIAWKAVRIEGMIISIASKR